MDTPSTSSADMLPELKTKIIFFSNEYPSDDLRDLFRRLHRHAKDKRFPFLSAFLDESTATINEEASKLPRPLQDLIPSFNSILTLADHGDFRHGPLGAAMESALLTVLEIGMLIGHYERNDLEYDLQKTNTTLAGLSIGLLAGAAVAVAPSLAGLVRAGAESARISFRLGVYVDNISKSLESCESEGNLESWAYVVTGLGVEDVKQEIDKYNRETSNPEITKVFLSAADKNSVSVTGPPSRLKDAFRSSQVLRYSKYLPLPVYDGLCHAAHIYNTEDINFVINGSEPKWPRIQRVQLPLISSKTGAPFSARTSGELFEQIGAELLTGTIYLDNVTNGILSRISDTESSECELSLFRMSIVSKGLLAAIDSDLPHVLVTRKDFVDWSANELEPRMPRTAKESKLAIVGMSCRMPGGADTNELFWNLLVDKRDTCTHVPADRFDLESHYDPTGKTENATQTPWGNFIDNPGLFDSGFFNMSPREAEQTDPMARLALVTAYEALEMAGYAPNRTPSTRLKRVGTFYGQASDDWRELNGSQNISTYAVPGGERAFANGRINYFFKFAGPSFNIDTACSSGMAAVQAACSALWSNEADTVIAGGLNIITDPDNYAGLGNAHFLSKTGQCKVWDRDADGYCRADGVGSIVIKRLEDAVADNDNVIAVVLSGATNHSAEAISITHPHVGAQKDNYTQVMQSAGINPLDVSYVELHGTGTQAGDAVESESVGDVFAPNAPRRRADQKLLLGAVKSNIGHGEAAAGTASLIKLLLCYQKGQIPPHIGIKNINPTIPKDLLGKRGAKLVLETTAWPRLKNKKRYSVINSFGAHGGNTTMLLEDAPVKHRVGEDPRSIYPIVISAKGKYSLKANIESLLSYIDEKPDTKLSDLSYTLCARRFHHSSRVGTAVSDIVQMRKFLTKSIENASNIRAIPTNTPPIVFTFTGQGSFYTGIASKLFEDFPYFRTEILKLDRIVQGFGFGSIIPVIDGSLVESFSPLTTQLSITVIEIALVRFWALFGIKPSAVIGHSLGEYAAFVTAGVLSAADAIWLVGRRTQSMIATCKTSSHVMLSIRANAELTPDMIRKSCGGNDNYEISCTNGPNQIVIGGARNNIEAICKSLEEAGMQCNWLDLPFAFHTAQVEPILDSFEDIASHRAFKAPCVPVISPLLKRCIFDGKTINANYVRRACREPVDFMGAIKAAEENGIIDKTTIWLEIGPHPICTTFVRNQFSDAKTAISLKRNEDSWLTFTNAMAFLHCEGVGVNWNEFFTPHEKAHQLLELKAYSWNNKNYWIPYYGTWTLDKAFAKDNIGKRPALGAFPSTGSSLKTSLIHQVVKEEILETTGELIMISDMMHPDFYSALHGHTMNGHGVATSSIWCDMIFTVTDYLYRLFNPKAKDVNAKITGFECFHGQVAHKDKNKPQLLQLEASINMATESMNYAWFNVDSEGLRAPEAFALATVKFEDPASWKLEWKRVSHLVAERIESLTQMAANGTANRLSKNMAYTLFKNVVDYADRYRGMYTVVLKDYEAFADIELTTERHGTWHTPPHWIDSVSHLAGLIMNGSDASNTKDYFYVTPGYENFRMIGQLEAGAKYRSYVKMLPTEDPLIHAGDIYILQNGKGVIAMCGGIKFRRVPRLLMDQFFSPPDAKKSSTHAGGIKPAAKSAIPAGGHSGETKPNAVMKSVPTSHQPSKTTTSPVALPVKTNVEIKPPTVEEEKVATKEETVVEEEESGPVADVLRLLSVETGLGVEELSNDRTFVEIGVDSLMSLVLSEKLRNELGMEVKSSLFIECPTVGELKAWIEQYG